MSWPMGTYSSAIKACPLSSHARGWTGHALPAALPCRIAFAARVAGTEQRDSELREYAARLVQDGGAMGEAAPTWVALQLYAAAVLVWMGVELGMQLDGGWWGLAVGTYDTNFPVWLFGEGWGEVGVT
jgi:hypothetical protein